MVAVGAGRAGRAEYPRAIVVPFHRLIMGRGVKEITRGLGQPSRPDLACGIPAALAAGLVRQLKIRSDPVGRLPAAMPRMISAVDQFLARVLADRFGLSQPTVAARIVLISAGG